MVFTRIEWGEGRFLFQGTVTKLQTPPHWSFCSEVRWLMKKDGFVEKLSYGEGLEGVPEWVPLFPPAAAGFSENWPHFNEPETVNNEPVFFSILPYFCGAYHHCSGILGWPKSPFRISCVSYRKPMRSFWPPQYVTRWSLSCCWDPHEALGQLTWEVRVMPVLHFCKLCRPIFLRGECNTWKVSFCNFQMFFCYLWGRQIPFVFFVCILNTHTKPSSDDNDNIKAHTGTSLVVQWLRFQLAVWGTRFWSLVEDLRFHTPKSN